MTLPLCDLPYASSHWQEWGAKGRGFGTQYEKAVGDWIGCPALALTSRDRVWVLRHFPMAGRVHRAMGLAFTQDSVRQLCTLALLVRHGVPADARVLLIGDGFGVLAGLLRSAQPDVEITLVDLSFTLAEQEKRLVAAFGPEGFTFCHAGECGNLDARYDLAVNIASMQEMNPPEVARYFRFMRGRVKSFYCCNRESKTLPDGTVTRFADYPWLKSDKVLLDEPCPWHQWFIAARPRVVRRYDGPIRHRLVRLHTPGGFNG